MTIDNNDDRGLSGSNRPMRLVKVLDPRMVATAVVSGNNEEPPQGDSFTLGSPQDIERFAAEQDRLRRADPFALPDDDVIRQAAAWMTLLSRTLPPPFDSHVLNVQMCLWGIADRVESMPEVEDA